MVMVGAAVQFTAQVRVRESMEPPELMVVIPVGGVVQVPPVMVTVGGVV
jgi:hypothetical protein